MFCLHNCGGKYLKLCSSFGNSPLPLEQGVVGLEGHIELCSQYFVPPGLAWVERGMGALYISMPCLQGVVLLGAICLSHCPAAHKWPLPLEIDAMSKFPETQMGASDSLIFWQPLSLSNSLPPASLSPDASGVTYYESN